MSKGGGQSAKYQKQVDAQNKYNKEMHSWKWGQLKIIMLNNKKTSLFKR